MIYFTSDTHLDHTNIIEYANRPYSDVDEMNEDIVTKWNARVRPDDMVYHLGDFALTSKRRAANFVRRLNGAIRLIRGNHDKAVRGEVVDMFDWVRDYHEESYEGTKVVLCHYAFRVWSKSHHGSWNLHGHSHGTLVDLGIKQMDVGVDTNDMYPYSIEEIAREMAEREYDAPDHHGKRRKK